MIGCVADDLTGALDAALLLHAGGVAAPVVVGTRAFRRMEQMPSTVVLDVDSRGDQPEVAYRKVRDATRALLDAGYRQMYKKMSSTFQGHIGREVDAVMDEMGVDFAVVVPAFPSNGRTTKLGYHYIDSVLLSETGVGRHPTSPVTDSYLPRVLQAQTSRKVALVDFKTVQEGATSLREEFQRLSRIAGMAIVDVTSEADLDAVAEAARSLTVSAGGSALVGKLPERGREGAMAVPAVPEPALANCLVLAGSVSPVTAGQVSHALRSGLEGLRLDVLALLDSGTRELEMERAVRFAVDRLRSGRDVMIYTPSEPEAQAGARERGRELGIDALEVGLTIARGQAEVAARVIDETDLNRLVVAGGDTSSMVCYRLGLDTHWVLEEIQTGVPLSLSEGPRTLVTVLKSGNFGTEECVSHALARVRR
jgi:uncharacterized protein YgbK (DUF1537 family)